MSAEPLDGVLFVRVGRSLLDALDVRADSMRRKGMRASRSDVARSLLLRALKEDETMKRSTIGRRKEDV